MARGGAALSLATLACAALAVSCGEGRAPVRAAPWPEADQLFRRDERWVGGDGALTIDLGDDRVLWLFGDTFISRPAARSSEGAFFIRNSLAVQTGRDPSRAFLEFHWRWQGEAARSFLPEDGVAWFWPGHGAVVHGVLATFWGVLCPEGQSGFQPCERSWELVTIDNPDDPPEAWQPARHRPEGFDPGVTVGSAVIVRDGFVYAFGGRGDQHDIFLVRFPEEALARGDLSGASWRDGEGWSAESASPLIEGGAPELSVQYSPALARWVMFESLGYGQTTLGMRTAPELWGPWSDATPFFRPEESFEPDAFVYAGKGHAELSGADAVLTYVSGKEYVPRFVRVWFEP